MMEQSPEMIGGAGRQMHLMCSFVSRHNHFSDSVYLMCLYFLYIHTFFLIIVLPFYRYIYHKDHSILNSTSPRSPAQLMLSRV